MTMELGTFGMETPPGIFRLRHCSSLIAINREALSQLLKHKSWVISKPKPIESMACWDACKRESLFDMNSRKKKVVSIRSSAMRPRLTLFGKIVEVLIALAFLCVLVWQSEDEGAKNHTPSKGDSDSVLTLWQANQQCLIIAFFSLGKIFFDFSWQNMIY